MSCPVWLVFAVRMKKHWVRSYPLSALRRLWSESSLGAQIILLVLSWGGSNDAIYIKYGRPFILAKETHFYCLQFDDKDKRYVISFAFVIVFIFIILKSSIRKGTLLRKWTLLRKGTLYAYAFVLILCMFSIMICTLYILWILNKICLNQIIEQNHDSCYTLRVRTYFLSKFVNDLGRCKHYLNIDAHVSKLWVICSTCFVRVFGFINLKVFQFINPIHIHRHSSYYVHVHNTKQSSEYAH